MENLKKKKRGEYSDSYSFHTSNIDFDCGGVPIDVAPHGTLSTKGIPGSEPKQYVSLHEVVKMEVQGARPRVPPVATLTRNPLDPSYVWPIDEPPVVDNGKFVRDAMDVSDIEGAHVKKPYPESSRAQTIMCVKDINFPTNQSENRHV